MNAPTAVMDPFGVVRTTSLVPAVVAGVVTVTEFAEFTVTDVPATPPKVTDEVPVRFVPMMVTESPPFVEPLDGEILTMAGAVLTAAAAVSRPAPHWVVLQSLKLPVTGNVCAVASIKDRI